MKNQLVSYTAPLSPRRFLLGLANSDKFFRAAFERVMRGLKNAFLVVHSDSGRKCFGVETAALRAEVWIHDERAWSYFALQGSVGAGESYQQGLWSSQDLVSLLRIFAANEDAMVRLDGGLAKFVSPLQRLYQWKRQNSIEGSRANIHAHYDLGNDFFELFLDDTLTYSAAVFAEAGEELRSASLRKIHRLCDKLALQPSDHLLEIGTGWGALACEAAKRYGCRVTTTTISREQHQYAERLVQREGLGNRVTVLQRDYRDLRGQFDKLVSVEMIEAVGSEFYGEYFRQCGQLLKSNGLAVLQAITIDDRRYESVKHTPDFVRRCIFPGSVIPSVEVLNRHAAHDGHLRLVQLEELTPHYALTLKRWRETFSERVKKVYSLGFDAEFVRLWEFYLAYCEAGFAERYINSVQLLYAKPGYRGQPFAVSSSSGPERLSNVYPL